MNDGNVVTMVNLLKQRNYKTVNTDLKYLIGSWRPYTVWEGDGLQREGVDLYSVGRVPSRKGIKFSRDSIPTNTQKKAPIKCFWFTNG